MSIPVADVKRSGIVESLHRGTVAVAGSDGYLQYALGDASKAAFFRSAAKPFQGLAVVASGAADHFGFSEEELAVMVASHSGEDVHVRAVASMLDKIGVSEENLRCGAHMPLDTQAATKLIRAGEKPGPLHHNCSGKHAGMLALARFRSHPLEGYYRPDHPIQQDIRQQIALFTGVTAERILAGVDGCGVPVFVLPLANMALAYARFADEAWGEEVTRGAARRIREAMMRHPQMVGGTGRFDTVLMGLATGRLISKGGAEGVQCIGILTGKVGLALKIEDGSTRPIPVVVLDILKQLGVLGDLEAEALRDATVKPISSPQGEVVGSIDPVFGPLQPVSGRVPICA